MWLLMLMDLIVSALWAGGGLRSCWCICGRYGIRGVRRVSLWFGIHVAVAFYCADVAPCGYYVRGSLA